MQEELFATLRRVGIIDESIKLENVVLSREQNMLTVFFRCQREPSFELSQTLTDSLEERLGGGRVRVEWQSDKNNPALEVEAVAAETTLRQPSAPAGAKVTSGKRSIYGGFVPSGKSCKICALKSDKDKKIIEGTVVAINERNSFKNKRRRDAVSFPLDVSITDGTDTIYCSLLLDSEAQKASMMAELENAKKKKDRLLVLGVCKESQMTGELMVYANNICIVPCVEREDISDVKRVELHLHTRMSMQDGITEVGAAFETAKRFGHKALAITDHGVVQAFPAAAKAAKKTGVKPIFGVEGYLLRESELIEMDQTFVVFDLETTGLKPELCEIIEIGAVKLRDGVIVDRFQTFVNDGVVIPGNITELTGITTEMLQGAPNTREVLTQFLAFCEGCCLVAHNAEFDMSFVRFHAARFNLGFANLYADTLMLSRYLMHDLINHKLDTVCEALGVVLEGHHRATDDAAATGEVFLKLLQKLNDMGLDRLPVRSEETKQERGKKRSATNHIIILAKTQAGMKNLYRIVSYAHLDHFHYNPIIPFSLLSLYREGLILGSACEAGELYQAMLNQAEEERVEYLARTYDFLEIQPRCNNAFLVRENRATDERLLDTLSGNAVLNSVGGSSRHPGRCDGRRAFSQSRRRDLPRGDPHEKRI